MPDRELRVARTSHNDRCRLRTHYCATDVSEAMVLESVLKAAAIIGLVVALFQLLIWAYRLILARARRLQTNQVLVWAVGLIRACYTRKKRYPHTEMRNDVEIAIFEHSGQPAGSTDVVDVDDTVLWTHQISKKTTLNGSAPLRPHRGETLIDSAVQATGVNNNINQVLRRRLVQGCDWGYLFNVKGEFITL